MADNKITLPVCSNSESIPLSAAFNEHPTRMRLYKQVMVWPGLELPGWTVVFACYGSCHLLVGFPCSSSCKRETEVHILIICVLVV